MTLKHLEVLLSTAWTLQDSDVAQRRMSSLTSAAAYRSEIFSVKTDRYQNAHGSKIRGGITKGLRILAVRAGNEAGLYRKRQPADAQSAAGRPRTKKSSVIVADSVFNNNVHDILSGNGDLVVSLSGPHMHQPKHLIFTVL
jgi:hypothetical protein